MARALLRALAREYGKDARVTQLLRRAEVSIVPLLNPDGAQRVWDRAGWTSFRGSRVTARGVDPNRNFPSVPIAGARAWNSSSRRTWSPYYSGPYPLSEPECLALARLCKRQRYCAAIHFHSFGGVVFFPATGHPAAKQMFDVFRSVFPPAQRYLRYRPVPEPMSTLTGQLDLFLLQAFGTPSVTVEVSRPSWHLALQPLRWLHFFSWANPPNPQWWADNDVPAAIQALEALLDRSGGQPLLPEHPELGEQVP
ncbi:MAG: hypothetical protein KatS3mg077_2212 [Candidatus Binatia bacterium]|nr:MAG: hypothetical protein KatS3mg077_2212 [Candidatus Binatia bacterium]